MSAERIDIGANHWLEFYCWKPDRELNPQYSDTPDIERAGALVGHLTADGAECKSAIAFDIPAMRELNPDGQFWSVDSWEPLTVSPSLFCNPDKGGCGDHGFIQQGKWVKA